MQNLAKITTNICIFLDWNDARRNFVRNLAAMGCGTRVIIVRDGDCTVNPTLDADVIAFSPVVTRQMFETGLEQL